MSNASTGGNAYVPVTNSYAVVAESFGASPSATGAVNTAAINAALAQGGTVTLTKPGTYVCGSSQIVSFNGNTYSLALVIPSNTRLVVGANVTVQAAGGQTNPVLIQNQNANGSGDANISIEGGIWDGNRASQTRSDGSAMCAFMIWFSNVNALDLRRMTWTNSIAYHSFLSSVQQFRVENIQIYDPTPFINGDGVHIHGNSRDGVVRDISGDTGDDLIAMLTHDTSHSYTLPLDSGPISDILVENIVGNPVKGAYHLVTLVDFAAFPMSRVTVRNVSGNYTDGGVRLAGTAGVKQAMVVDTINCSPLAGTNPTYGMVSLESGGDSVTITNSNRYLNDSVETGTKIAPINVTGGTWNHVKVDNFNVVDLTAAGAGIGFIFIASGSTVSDLEVSNYSGAATTASDAYLWNAGTLVSAKLSNGETNKIHQLLFTAGNINVGVFVANYRGVNNSNPVILTSGAFTFPHLSLVGIHLDGTQNGGQGVIRISGVTGTMLIQAYATSISNGANPNISRAGAETIRFQSMDTSAPSGILTPARGDIILDSSNNSDPYRWSGSAWTPFNNGGAYTYNAPTTGFSITIANGIGRLILDPAGTLATGTVIMPSTPVDADEVGLSSTQIITALTVSGNTGQTMADTVSTLGVGSAVKFKWVAAQSKWYRVAN